MKMLIYTVLNFANFSIVWIIRTLIHFRPVNCDEKQIFAERYTYNKDVSSKTDRNKPKQHSGNCVQILLLKLLSRENELQRADLKQQK